MRAIQAIGQEDQEDRVQRQALEYQLMQLKSSAASEDIPEAIQSVEEKKLEELHDDAQPEKGSDEAALERLRGEKDTFQPADRRLVVNTDQVDREIEGLKRSIESMEQRAMDTLDPEEAEELDRELQLARAQLRRKGSVAYRRLRAQYTAIFEDKEDPRPAVFQAQG